MITMEVYGKVHTLYRGKVKTVGNPDAERKMDQQWQTGAFKQQLSSRFLSAEGLTGDECADKKNHGGKEKALFAYSVLTMINGSGNWAIRISGPGQW